MTTPEARAQLKRTLIELRTLQGYAEKEAITLLEEEISRLVHILDLYEGRKDAD
jgi:hypothetical protein